MVTTSNEPDRDPEPGNAPPPTRHTYDAAFLAMESGGRVLADCYLRAFGDEALGGAEPFSSIAAGEMRWLIRTAGLESKATIVDLGCGRGGPGIVFAQWTNARLIGVDWSIVAVRAATRAAARAGINPPGSYVACDARALPFANRTIEALISIDVLQLIPDREAVLQEAGRVLRPGGVLAFTSWELTHDQGVPPRLLRIPRSYTKLVDDANLKMEAIEVSDGSRERDEVFWACVEESATELRRELGDDVAERILEEASLTDVFNASTRRVLCVARAGT